MIMLSKNCNMVQHSKNQATATRNKHKTMWEKEETDLFHNRLVRQNFQQRNQSVWIADRTLFSLFSEERSKICFCGTSLGPSPSSDRNSSLSAESSSTLQVLHTAVDYQGHHVFSDQVPFSEHLTEWASLFLTVSSAEALVHMVGVCSMGVGLPNCDMSTP